jgi:hypothetical protein
MNVAVLTILIFAVMTAPLLITFAVRRRARTPYEPRHTAAATRPDQSLPWSPVNPYVDSTRDDDCCQDSPDLTGELGVVRASQSPDSDVIVASVTSIADRRPA